MIKKIFEEISYLFAVILTYTILLPIALIKTIKTGNKKESLICLGLLIIYILLISKCIK